jgi:hypothetical protein
LQSLSDADDHGGAGIESHSGNLPEVDEGERGRDGDEP